MGKANSREKMLGDRKPGELIETFGDFWLGMAGAVGRGLSKFAENRRKNKKDGAETDFLRDATDAFAETMSAAQEVTEQVQKDLQRDKNGS